MTAPGNFYARVGAVRPSQMLYTYGPGSVIDLPQMSVMVTGLDDWSIERMTPIIEDRLLSAVKSQLGNHVTALRPAPWAPEDRSPFGDWTKVGVPVTAFPRWVRCTACDQLGTIDTGLFVPWTNPFRPDWAKWVHRNCQRRKEALAVAARYVLACEKGHMDDFPWVEFAHHGNQACETPMLSMYELSPGATAADVWVKCGCAQYKPRPLGIVFGPNGWTRLPKCRGRHPHLRSFTPDCDGRVRALLLGASNAWFGVTLSALSIPRTREPLQQLVERLWGHLGDVDDEAVLGYAMKKTPELGVLAVHDRADVWAAVEARRGGEAEAGPGTLDLLPAEWEVLCDPVHAPSSDDFLLSESEVPVGQEERISQVVLAQRLREVVAITGMTRIEAPVRNKDGQVLNLASLSRAKVDWVPACEVRGEGVFLRLDETRLAGWEDYAAGLPRVEGMRLAHKAYLEVRGADTTADWPGARYVLLHTLSHLLIREIALECGYAAASIRERIYSRSGADTMAGVLFYTAAPDSEGTLGGLVALGKKDVLGRILSQALEHARLCSSDPLCAEHVPHADDQTMHGAACHACAFAAETSCERGNRYLDRNLVVETLCGEGISYFG